MNVLCIGNSFSMDATHYLHAIARADGERLKVADLYIGGCSLERHYRNMLSGEREYTLDYNGQHTGFPVSLQEALKNRPWDVVTLQQCSPKSHKWESYEPYLSALADFVRKWQPAAKLYIHQTWSYGDAHNNHTSNPTYTGGTMAAMWTKIEAAYNSAATETGLELIPAGQAIQNAQEALNAGGYSETNIQRDNAHVSKTWGRYLLARVWYEALTGETPTVTLDQLNTSVAANSAMETLVKNAAAAALNEYPVEEAA